MEILKAIPINHCEIVLQFSNGALKKFVPGKLKLPGHYDFLSYQPKVNAFIVTPEQLTWYNEIVLGADFLYTFSEAVDLKDLIRSALQLGSRNNAPTSQHSGHHVYYAYLNPFNYDKPITIGESIGGGMAEAGGCTTLSIPELYKWNWEDHFRKSDCDWVIEIIKNHKDNTEKIIDQMVLQVCERQYLSLTNNHSDMSYIDSAIYKAHERLGFPPLPHAAQLDILLNGNYEPILSLTPEFRKDGFPLGMIREYITMSKAEFKAYLQATNFLRLQEKEYSQSYDGFWFRLHENGFIFFERERGHEFNQKVVKTKDEVLDLFVEQYWRWCK